MKGKNILYSILIIGLILLNYQIYRIVNILSARGSGFLIWEGGITILLLIVSMLLSFRYTDDKRMRNGILITISIMVVQAVIMLNYATLMINTDQLMFYFHLAITTSVVILAIMIGNVLKIEKKEEEGFNAYIYDSKSIISPKMLIPVWLMIFFGFGIFVYFTGHTLLSYPIFGVLKGLGGPMTSGSVADWENLCFMIFPAAIAYMILTKFMKVPRTPAIIISILVGALSFASYHNLRYSTDMIAMIVVLIFGIIFMSLYNWLKTLAVISAVHFSNNFWGAVFGKTIIAFQAVGGNGSSAGSVWTTLLLIIVMCGIIFIALKIWGKKNAEKK